jgi:hypothetical protein
MTVTDAALLVGILGHGVIGFGAITPRKELAQVAARPIAAKLGIDLAELSEGVLKVTVSGMLIAIEQMLARAGVHASELTLMPFGGAGPMLGTLLAEAAGIKRILIPAAPGTGNLGESVKTEGIVEAFADMSAHALDAIVIAVRVLYWASHVSTLFFVGTQYGRRRVDNSCGSAALDRGLPVGMVAQRLCQKMRASISSELAAAMQFWELLLMRRSADVNSCVSFLSGTSGRFERLFLEIEIKERRLADVDARNDGRDHDVTQKCETSAH